MDGLYPKVDVPQNPIKNISNLGVPIILGNLHIKKRHVLCVYIYTYSISIYIHIYILFAKSMFNPKHGHILDSLREYQNTAVYGRPSVLISLA